MRLGCTFYEYILRNGWMDCIDAFHAVLCLYWCVTDKTSRYSNRTITLIQQSVKNCYNFMDTAIHNYVFGLKFPKIQSFQKFSWGRIPPDSKLINLPLPMVYWLTCVQRLVPAILVVCANKPTKIMFSKK